MDPQALLASPCCTASPGGRPWTPVPTCVTADARKQQQASGGDHGRKPTSHRTRSGRPFLLDCPWESGAEPSQLPLHLLLWGAEAPSSTPWRGSDKSIITPAAPFSLGELPG